MSKPFTFPTSGKEIKVRKVSPQVMTDAALTLPAPQPPMQEVELDGQKRLEANPAHPDYLKAVQDYQIAQQRLTQKLLVRLGVDYVLSQDDRNDLKRTTDVLEELNIPLGGDSELERWINYVAVVSAEDMGALMDEVLSLSVPTPKSD